jgi:succinate dehydrogenase / fumarate reductase flavoprotein subunit
MQGLADGYFVVPPAIGNYLGTVRSLPAVDASHPAVQEALDAVRGRIHRLLSVQGSRTVDDFHKALGRIMWDKCGMGRTEAGLKEALEQIPRLRDEFWRDVRVPGSADSLNQSLEKAGRVADFLEHGELMVRDALERAESCGGHFREESQTEEGEALRDDERFSHVAVWEYKGEGQSPQRHQEELSFEHCIPSQRSYK